jgi:hypothetical protein
MGIPVCFPVIRLTHKKACVKYLRGIQGYREKIIEFMAEMGYKKYNRRVYSGLKKEVQGEKVRRSRNEDRRTSNK